MFSDGAAALILGALIRYLIGKRRFKRRNMAGLQRFKNFNVALITTCLEWVVRAIGLLMIITGLGILILKWL